MTARAPAASTAPSSLATSASGVMPVSSQEHNVARCQHVTAVVQAPSERSHRTGGDTGTSLSALAAWPEVAAPMTP